jgi:DNA-binding PadR family transcriptional regulator
MENLDVKQLAFIARAMYSCGRKPHQICYLLCLKQKGELSIDELACYMAGLLTPSGKPIQRNNVYSHMYALEKQGFVIKDKALSEEGKACNLYTISPIGEDQISELLQVGSSWESIQGHINMLAMFGTSNMANIAVAQAAAQH